MSESYFKRTITDNMILFTYGKVINDICFLYNKENKRWIRESGYYLQQTYEWKEITKEELFVELL